MGSCAGGWQGAFLWGQRFPAPTPAIIPREGTWVRVEYNGTFVCWVGNPGSLRRVGGSGRQLYPIRNKTSYVQASFLKQDCSGKTLTVEVYTSGMMTYHRTVRSLRGGSRFSSIQGRQSSPESPRPPQNRGNKTGGGGGGAGIFFGMVTRPPMPENEEKPSQNSSDPEIVQVKMEICLRGYQPSSSGRAGMSNDSNGRF
jgi:hypothetical protein